MYARVCYMSEKGLSKTYDFKISEELASELIPNDWAVIESSRNGYAAGVYVGSTETVDDPKIVTKSVIQRIDVKPYQPDRMGSVLGI